MATKKEKTVKPAKQKKIKPVKQWDIVTIERADKIVDYSKTELGGNTHENHVRACQELFGVRYIDDRMSEVRSRLSWLGGKNSHKAIGTKQFPENLLKQEWLQELSANKSMQHGLHPEDDAELIELLNQEQ
jgi:hypothetical protein